MHFVTLVQFHIGYFGLVVLPQKLEVGEGTHVVIHQQLCQHLQEILVVFILPSVVILIRPVIFQLSDPDSLSVNYLVLNSVHVEIAHQIFGDLEVIMRLFLPPENNRDHLETPWVKHLQFLTQ